MKKKRYRELQKIREKDMLDNNKLIKKLRKEIVKKEKKK